MVAEALLVGSIYNQIGATYEELEEVRDSLYIQTHVRRKVLPDGYCQQSRELTVADAPDSRIGPTVQWTFRSRGS